MFEGGLSLIACATKEPMSVETSDLLREEVVFKTLSRLGACLLAPTERTRLELGDIPVSNCADGALDLLIAGAKQAGIYLKKTDVSRVDEVFSLIREGHPVVRMNRDGSFMVVEKIVGRRLEVSIVGEHVTHSLASRRELGTLLSDEPDSPVLVAKRELECDSLSATPGHHAGRHHGAEHHEHPTPLRRYLELLRLDSRDIWTVLLFATVAGVLALATPLAVESLVNVVSWGTYLQPLVVLAFMLLACLGLAGMLRILQTVVVELIQRRQFVRLVGDLSHRFPRANQETLEGRYPRELANRFFDIMTIQKATAVLLLDGISLLLATVMGLLLLAFYHPFLLGFDLVLVMSMLLVTWALGRGGIAAAIDESIVKYKTAHWLQDVLAFPTAFKINGGETLAVERANRLAAEYIGARELKFRVVIRQVAFAIGLQVIASTAVLGLGGWLVIQGQLTLGQLVASELIITVVVGAFAKLGLSLEKFYELMAGVDKVGHLLDISVDPRHELGHIPAGPAEVHWDDLSFRQAGTASKVPAAMIEPGARVAVIGDDVAGRSLLAKSLAGLIRPRQGLAEVAGYDAQHAAVASGGHIVGYAGGSEIFHATLQENVDLGRSGIGQNRVREILRSVGLWHAVLRLPCGLQATLQTDGHPLTTSQISQLLIARAMAGQPRLLIIDGLLDGLSEATRATVWAALSAVDAPWTLLITTNCREIAECCDRQILVNLKT